MTLCQRCRCHGLNSHPSTPDLYEKQRELAKIQILEREIGFLDVISKDLYVQVYSVFCYFHGRFEMLVRLVVEFIFMLKLF